MAKEQVEISRYEPREVKTGHWAWVLVKKLVSLPMAVLNFRFGWHEGANPPEPAGDAAEPADRVGAMRR